MARRRILTTGALALVFLSATPATAQTAIVTGSCSATVDGQPGQPLMLDQAAVAGPIEQALAKVDPLGLLAGAFPGEWAASGPIPLGSIPDRQTQVPGTAIADAVNAQLSRIPLLGPVLGPLTTTVHQTLSGQCGILERPILPASPPPPGAAQQPAAPGNAGGAVSPGGAGAPATGWQVVPSPDPGAPSGGAVFGSRLPDGALFPLSTDRAPGVGAPVAGNAPATVVEAPQAAGSAAALPMRRDGVSTATLTALLLLSVVSALLVRRWVLGGRG